jgi:hypothetical protein
MHATYIYTCMHACMHTNVHTYACIPFMHACMYTLQRRIKTSQSPPGGQPACAAANASGLGAAFFCDVFTGHRDELFDTNVDDALGLALRDRARAVKVRGRRNMCANEYY